MKQGHFHVHMSKVKSIQGQSSIAAVAYQSGQSLSHEQQHCATVSADHRKMLNKEELTEAFRDALRKPDPDILASDLQKAEKDPADKKKKQVRGIWLSDGATVEKIKRGLWKIQDGEQSYTVKEYRQRVKDPESGERVEKGYWLDVYADRQHSYVTREDVLATWMTVPHIDQVPVWADRTGTLYNPTPEQHEKAWQAIETKDKNRDSVPAIKLELSYLRDLPLHANTEVAQAFIQEHFTSKGYLVSAAVHQKEASDGKDNTHLHLVVGTRPVQADGSLADDKQSLWNRGFNHKELATQFRQSWARLQNQQLERFSLDVRVDPRSHAARGLELEPQIHIGKSDWNIEQRQAAQGKEKDTLRGNENRAIQERNKDKPKKPFWFSQTVIDAYYKARGVFTEKKPETATPHHKPEPMGAFTQTAQKKWAFFKGVYENVTTRFTDVYQRFKTEPDNQTYQEKTKQHDKERQEAIKRLRPRSRDERQVMQRLYPYLQQQQWDDPKDQAHLIAKTMQMQRELAERERREQFDRIARRDQAMVRERAIHQDRVLKQDRERERERQRQYAQQRRQAGRAGNER